MTRRLLKEFDVATVRELRARALEGALRNVRPKEPEAAAEAPPPAPRQAPIPRPRRSYRHRFEWPRSEFTPPKSLPDFPESWREPGRAVASSTVAELLDVSEPAARRWLETVAREVAPDRFLAVDVLRRMFAQSTKVRP